MPIFRPRITVPVRTVWLTLLAAVIAPCARPAALPEVVDPRLCTGLQGTHVSATVRGDHVQLDVRPSQSESGVQIMFRQPLLLRGKERLLIEARGEESSGLRVCNHWIELLGPDASAAARYDPDLNFPPEWNQRTVLLTELKGSLPQEITGARLGFWAPHDVGKEFRFYLRRFAFLSVEEVAAAVRPPVGAPRPHLPAKSEPLPRERQTWRSFGPGGGGWYRVVAISPHDGVCFVGADVGGIYRSADLCQSWQIVSHGIPNTYVNAFAFHPTTSSIIFAGTNGGVLKSTDGGSSWTIKRDGFPPLLTFGLSAPVSAVAVHPVESKVVYAGVGHERRFGQLREGTIGGRIFKSADGGETWRMVELPGAEEVRKLSVFSIRFRPRDREVMFASTQGSLFRSRDAGESWTRWGKGVAGLKTTFLTMDRADPDTMLLAYCDSEDGRGGVLKSEDGGASWRPCNSGLPNKQNAWRIVAHPTDSSTYFVGWHRGDGLYATRDRGETWRPLNALAGIRSAWFFPGQTVTGLDIDPRNPDRLVYCNDMDLYQTLDNGRTWDQVATRLVRPATADRPAVWQGRGCEVLCAGGPQALAVDPTNPSTIYFGYMDTHAWKSDDGGRTCYRLTNGISSGYGRMGAVVLDPHNADIVYLSKGRNYDEHRVYKSVDAGRVFHLVGHADAGLPPGAVFSMAIDPSSPPDLRTVYAAVTGYGVYKSEDGGLSWRECSKGLPGDSRKATQIAMDPGDPKRLFLASGAHYHRGARRRVPGYIARTTDGGARWEVVKDKIEPQCIAIDPFDSQRVYAGNRNFSGVDYPNAIYRSADGGNTWTSLDQTPFLQGAGSRNGDQGVRVYVSCLACDPTKPGRVYAACREEGYDVSNGRGVFVSDDWGETWRPFGSKGLANYSIGTLIVDPVDPARLYAGTGGNGLFCFGAEPDTPSTVGVPQNR